MDELVYRHLQAQRLLARNTVAELALYWPQIDIDNIRGSTAPWLKSIRPVIERGYLTSQYLAAEFYKNYRRQVLPNAEPFVLDVPNPFGAFGVHQPAPRDTQMKIMVSQKVTGPDWVENHTTGQEAYPEKQEILRNGFSKSSGSAIRLVLGGGRGLVLLAVLADPLAMGIQRVVDPQSDCTSCIAAGREPVLKSAGKERMWKAVAGHDFDACGSRPVFT